MPGFLALNESKRGEGWSYPALLSLWSLQKAGAHSSRPQRELGAASTDPLCG